MTRLVICDATRNPSAVPGHLLALTFASVVSAAGAAPADAMAPLLPMAPLASNVFVQALTHGRAAAPLPDDERWADVARALKQQAGSDSTLEITAMRVLRFNSQARCGRVVFALWQPASKKAWPQIGGQLNLCDDGMPPLQECAQQPGRLVPVGHRCGDGSVARDTAEVRQAIHAAIAAGGLSAQDVRRSLGVAGANGAPTASAANAASAATGPQTQFGAKAP